jgi:hypothetical protein
MHIESRSTAWWRNRTIMFLVMFLAAGIWFAYDGYVKYPAENLKWAKSAMTNPPSDLRPNPRVIGANLQRLVDNYNAASKAGKNLTVAELKSCLGDPSVVQGRELWFVGPAAYLRAIEQDNGKVLLDSPQVATKPSENSIWWQKATAAVAFLVAGWAAVNLVRALRTHVVLDDAGLKYNSRLIPWDAMTGLRTERYKPKGWVELDYTADGAARSIRLDSFHLENFDPILTAICERKGFPSPLTAAAPGGSDDSSPAKL